MREKITVSKLGEIGNDHKEQDNQKELKKKKTNVVSMVGTKAARK